MEQSTKEQIRNCFRGDALIDAEKMITVLEGLGVAEDIQIEESPQSGKLSIPRQYVDCLEAKTATLNGRLLKQVTTQKKAIEKDIFLVETSPTDPNRILIDAATRRSKPAFHQHLRTYGEEYGPMSPSYR